jgi:ATPase subunit of ABC transporter with duplicated ATPase domains
LRQLEGRLGRTKRELEKIKVKKEYTLGIWLPGSQSRRDVLLDLPSGSLGLGEHRELRYPNLLIKPDDRIAITGKNGVGKSTLIREIVKSVNVPCEQITYIPQEIEIGQSEEILHQIEAAPRENRGHLMSIVSRLGSRPQRLLDSTTPSPGETRKMLLALGMIKEPHIIIMDEPTNHMDLPSIECLEEALNECACCLVLVSHDEYFLAKVAYTRWHIGRHGAVEGRYCLETSRLRLPKKR